MNTTQIKRLFQSDKEFVPITLAEAVVVNTTDIPGLKSLGITTLDKVLSTTLGVVDTTVQGINTLNKAVANINLELLKKLNKLTPGTGITITDEGVISTTVASIELYKLVKSLPSPSKECMNTIYLVTSPKGVVGNALTEYICIYSESSRAYIWELIGTILTDVDLTGYISREEFTETITPITLDITNIKQVLASTITAKDVETSKGDKVIVDYIIPKELYDNI